MYIRMKILLLFLINLNLNQEPMGKTCEVDLQFTDVMDDVVELSELFKEQNNVYVL